MCIRDSKYAKSNWILEQVDIRGWAHLFSGEASNDFIKHAYGMHILFVLMPPHEISKEIQEKYLKWCEEYVLLPIKNSTPDLYAWILNWEKEQVIKLSNTLSEQYKVDDNG